MIHGRWFAEDDPAVLAYLAAAVDALEAARFGRRNGMGNLPASVVRARDELRSLTTPPGRLVVERDPECANCGASAERLRVGECEACYRYRRRTGRTRRKSGDKRPDSWGHRASLGA